MKNKIATIGIIIATLILAGVAVFTAIRLYQLRKEAVAPTAPTSKPKAQVVPIACQSLAFTLGQIPTPTASPTATPTPTGSPTVTPTPTTTGVPNSCNGTCGSDSNCLSGYYFCYNGHCRDRSCPDREDCTCPGTSTATPGPTATPPIAEATPTLPNAGTSLPSILGIGIGSLLLIGALILAL